MNDTSYTKQTENASAIFEWAQRFHLALGVLVPDTKDPFAEEEWHPTRHYSRNRADHELWLSKGCNFALPAAPNNLIVMDFDPRNGGAESYQAWCKEHGHFDIAWTTRSGGAHILFRAPAGVALSGRKPKKYPGVDIICNGYVVMPPSVVGDGRYLAHDEPSIHEPPEWLSNICRTTIAQNAVPSPDTKREIETLLGGLTQAVIEQLHVDWPEGERSEKIAGMVGRLIRAGYSDDEIAALLVEHTIGNKFEKNLNRARNEVVRLRGKGYGAKKSAAKTVESPSIVPAGGTDMISGDPATVWVQLDKFSAPHAGNWKNAEVLLRRLRVEVRWNAWTERPEIRGLDGDAWIEQQDHRLDKIARLASAHPHFYRPGESVLRRAIDSISRDNTVDPARDLLDCLQREWDGTPRLTTWLHHACGVPADDYHSAVGVSILVGLVARIRVPGIKYDLMPVLVDETQGTQKSSLARLLALDDDWFAHDMQLGESSKELVQSLAGKCVAEISEMRTRGEVNTVKAMISRTHDEGRPAYGRKPIKRARRHIFVGSTNDVEFLEDQSGGRRFLPIRVQGEINLEWVRAYLAQLVGEAATLQSQGALVGLPREVWAIAGEHQEAARAKSGVEILLEEWFPGEAPMWVSAGNLVLLLRAATGRDVSAKTYGKTMRKLKFVSKAFRPAGDESEPVRAWVRDPDGNRCGKDIQGFGGELGRYSGRPVALSPTPPALPAPRGDDVTATGVTNLTAVT
jgi:hypothetical protein